jgi:hypothetical protein
MKQLSYCRDINGEMTHTLWHDPLLDVYAIFGRPGTPAIFEKNEDEAWKRFRLEIGHGTNSLPR